MAAGLLKKTVAEILEGARKAWGEQVWKISKESFVKKLQTEAYSGVKFLDVAEDTTREALEKAAQVQKMHHGVGSVPPGFHAYHLPAGATRYETKYFVQTSATGEVMGTAYATRKAARDPWELTGIYIKKEYRKGGHLAKRLMGEMVLTGAFQPQSFSTAGARAYSNYLRHLEETGGMLQSMATPVARPAAKAATGGMSETERLVQEALGSMTRNNAAAAAMKVHNAQPQGTPSRIAKSLYGNRGSRQGRSGGNG